MALVFFKALTRWLLYAVTFEHQGRRGHLSFFLSTWTPLRVRSRPPPLNLSSLHFPGIWNMGTYLGRHQPNHPRLSSRNYWDREAETTQYQPYWPGFGIGGSYIVSRGNRDNSWGRMFSSRDCRTSADLAKPGFERWSWLHRLWNCFYGPGDCELPPYNFKHTEPFIKCECNTKCKTHTKQMCRVMTCYEANTFVNNVQARR